MLSRRRGVSFLSRLSMRGSKKKDDDFDDAGSELSDLRTDGTNARVFSTIVGAGGYIPRHKEPPRYIRTKAHNKKDREFNRMFLAQELIGTRPPAKEKDEKVPLVTVITATEGRKTTETGGAIWTTEFSKDGRYLAAAGRDEIFRVWAVISTHEDRKAHEEEEIANGVTGERLSAPVFLEKPIQEFEGHTGEILNLSWSKNNFILSTSMDKTVRLWHVSRKECLCTFKHKEFVSKVAFHPTDDRFFLAGCLDTTLRLWSIPDKAVAFSVQLPDLITAVAFSPDGKTAIAGLLNGLCYFYDTEGLKPQAHIHVRSSRGKNAKGSKITGIQTMRSPDGKEGDVKVLITSTDSRIRTYNLRDKTADLKFKGHEHACSQLSASFSDDGKYVICGSEDRKAFIWSMSSSNSENKDKKPCECFDAHSDIVTTAIFAPTKTRQLLGSSGDPLYDLCNPPPVTLMSMEEATASQTALPENPQSEPQANIKKPEESPAYIARSTHYDGNIIVTSDDRGIIKVFRQDCAFLKRKHESWETGSAFSKKLAANPGLIGRSASILTRTSASSAAHSRRGSLSQVPPGVTSGPSSATGTPNLGNSDRIISWRQGIEHNGRSSLAGSLVGTPTRSERSISPSKTSRTALSSVATLASGARKQPYASSSPTTPQFSHGPIKTHPTSPTSSTFSIPRRGEKATPQEKAAKDKLLDKDESKSPPAPSFTFRPADDDDQLRLDPAGASYGFWNLNKWKGIAGLRNSAGSGASTTNSTPGGHSKTPSDAGARDGSATSTLGDKEKMGPSSGRRSLGSSVFPKTSLPTLGDAGEGSDSSTDRSVRRRHLPRSSLGRIVSVAPPGVDDTTGEHLAPPGDHSPYERASIISMLSSELTSEGEPEDTEMTCTKCGGREFKAKRLGARHRLMCGRCGKLVDEEFSGA